MIRPLQTALEKVDSMPVEKLAHYAEWKEAREAILHALKSAQELERAERLLTTAATAENHEQRQARCGAWRRGASQSRRG